MQLPSLFSKDSRVQRKFRALAFAIGSPSYFEERQRDQELIRKYQTIFKQGGLITQAINCYPEYMFMNVLDTGFEFVGEDEKQVEYVENLVTGINFLDASWQQVTNSLVEGSGIAQVVPNRAGGVYGLLPQDSALYSADMKDTGEISTYYKKGKSTWTKGTPVKVEDVWHLNLLPQTGSPWGQSLVGLAYDEIMRDTKTAEGIAENDVVVIKYIAIAATAMSHIATSQGGNASISADTTSAAIDGQAIKIKSVGAADCTCTLNEVDYNEDFVAAVIGTKLANDIASGKSSWSNAFQGFNTIGALVGIERNSSDAVVKKYGLIGAQGNNAGFEFATEDYYKKNYSFQVDLMIIADLD